MEERWDDIPDYAGYCPSCPRCGETMGYNYSEAKFKCLACDFIMDEDDWNHEEDEIGTPWGCTVCGGPYPDCLSSCKMFDD